MVIWVFVLTDSKKKVVVVIEHINPKAIVNSKDDKKVAKILVDINSLAIF